MSKNNTLSNVFNSSRMAFNNSISLRTDRMKSMEVIIIDGIIKNKQMKILLISQNYWNVWLLFVLALAKTSSVSTKNEQKEIKPNRKD